MHFSIAATFLPLLVLSTHALPVPRPRHVNGIDIHPQAKTDPTPSANLGSFPIPTRPATPTPTVPVQMVARKFPAGKMTNAQRMALGMGPKAPTRRSSAPKRRTSQSPMNNADPSNEQDAVVRVVSEQGEDMGMVTNNGSGDDGLMTFSPGGTPMRFAIPESAGPFELGPSELADDIFGQGRKLLGAIPHRPDAAGSQMGQGNPNFANLGQGSCDTATGLLGMTLPPLPMADPSGGVISGLPGLLGATLPSNPLSALSNPTSGLDGLLNVAGPLNLLGGGGSSDDASSSDDNGDDDSFGGGGSKFAARPGRPGSSIIPEEMMQPMRQPAQQAIWSCDEAGNLGAVWQNPGGGVVPAKFFTGGPCVNTICISADVGLLKSIHGGDLKEVNLVAGLL